MTNNTDLFVCRLQGEIFEKSLEKLDCGSATFIRNYMNSDIAKHIDINPINIETIGINQVFNELIKQYGNKKYGKRKYNSKALYWIGYTYRFWNIQYNVASKSIYKIINGNEMNELYLPYHTLSSEKAIQRIIESKGQNIDDSFLYNTMKKILTL